MPAQFDLPPWIESLTLEYAVKLLLFGVFGNTAPSGGGLPAPSGTGNVNVAQIGGAAMSLGQQLAAASLPVVLTAAQIAALSSPAEPSGTPSIFAKTAGQTETIPIGAFNIGVIINTGTGTIGGVAWPTGVPFNISAKTAATIAVVCATPGTASINYLT